MEPEGQPGPRPQAAGQPRWPSLLQNINQDDKEDQPHQGTPDCSQHRAPCQGEPKGRQGQQQEGEEQIDNGHPAVAGSQISKALGQWDGQPQDGHQVPQQYAGQVEEEVNEGNLVGKMAGGSGAWAR